MIVSASEFKAKCLHLMDRVAETHEPILITKRGAVVAQLIAAPAPARPWLALRGTGEIHGDLVEPVANGEESDAAAGRELLHRRRE